MNLAVQQDIGAAFLIADTAYVRPDGIVHMFAPKVLHSPPGALPFALGITGSVPPHVVQAAMDATALDRSGVPATIEELKARLPAWMRDALAVTAEIAGRPASEFQLSIIGAAWNAADRDVEGFVCTSDPALYPGQDVGPFEVYWTEWVAQGANTIGLDVMLGRPMDLAHSAIFDPEIDGITLVRAQRRANLSCMTPGVDGEQYCRIGGEITLSEVREDGVQFWSLHEFPDQVGELIDAST